MGGREEGREGRAGGRDEEEDGEEAEEAKLQEGNGGRQVAVVEGVAAMVFQLYACTGVERSRRQTCLPSSLSSLAMALGDSGAHVVRRLLLRHFVIWRHRRVGVGGAFLGCHRSAGGIVCVFIFLPVSFGWVFCGVGLYRI